MNKSDFTNKWLGKPLAVGENYIPNRLKMHQEFYNDLDELIHEQAIQIDANVLKKEADWHVNKHCNNVVGDFIESKKYAIKTPEREQREDDFISGVKLGIEYCSLKTNK